MATDESKMKSSKLLKRKNCLLQEISQFNNYIGRKIYENNSSNITFMDIGDSSEISKEIRDRKRKFEDRPVHIEVPLITYFDFQNEMAKLEKETDLAFM